MFVAEGCQLRALPIIRITKQAGSEYLQILNQTQTSGWFDADITARVADHGLVLLRVQSLVPIRSELAEDRARKQGFLVNPTD